MAQNTYLLNWVTVNGVIHRLAHSKQIDAIYNDTNKILQS